MDITEILLAVISLLSVAITSLVAPWLKEKLSDAKFEKAKKYTLIAVKAAEKIYDPKDNSSKFKYVQQFLQNHNITYDTAQIEALIESCVYDVKESIYSVLDTTEQEQEAEQEVIDTDESEENDA